MGMLDDENAAGNPVTTGKPGGGGLGNVGAGLSSPSGGGGVPRDSGNPALNSASSLTGGGMQTDRGPLGPQGQSTGFSNSLGGIRENQGGGWTEGSANSTGVQNYGRPSSLSDSFSDPRDYGTASLMSFGWNPRQTTGMMGGIFGESNYDPTAVNPSSNAFGLAQWLGERKQGLFDTYGPNPTAAQQYEYIDDELRGRSLYVDPQSKRFGDRLQANPGMAPADVTREFTKQYERPSKKEYNSSIGKRIEEGETLFGSNGFSPTWDTQPGTAFGFGDIQIDPMAGPPPQVGGNLVGVVNPDGTLGQRFEPKMEDRLTLSPGPRGPMISGPSYRAGHPLDTLDPTGRTGVVKSQDALEQEISRETLPQWGDTGRIGGVGTLQPAVTESPWSDYKSPLTNDQYLGQFPRHNLGSITGLGGLTPAKYSESDIQNFMGGDTRPGQVLGAGLSAAPPASSGSPEIQQRMFADAMADIGGSGRGETRGYGGAKGYNKGEEPKKEEEKPAAPTPSQTLADNLRLVYGPTGDPMDWYTAQRNKLMAELAALGVRI